MGDHDLGFGRQGLLGCPAGAICHFEVLLAALLVLNTPAFGMMAALVSGGPYGAPIASPGLSCHRYLLEVDCETEYK